MAGGGRSSEGGVSCSEEPVTRGRRRFARFNWSSSYFRSNNTRCSFMLRPNPFEHLTRIGVTLSTGPDKYRTQTNTNAHILEERAHVPRTKKGHKHTHTHTRDD